MVRFLIGLSGISLLQNAHTDSAVRSASCARGSGTLSPGMTWPGREANHQRYVYVFLYSILLYMHANHRKYVKSFRNFPA
jgi:hypothetical protein